MTYRPGEGVEREKNLHRAETFIHRLSIRAGLDSTRLGSARLARSLDAGGPLGFSAEATAGLRCPAPCLVLGALTEHVACGPCTAGD